jgi:type II secretory pathway component GspD/PulD (secretin)/tetratricopeptide (TPR) repeat protein
MGKTLRWLAVLALVLSLSCVLFRAYAQEDLELVGGESEAPIEEVGVNAGGDETLEEAELTAEEIAESIETDKALEAQMAAETAKREADAAVATGDYDLAVARLKGAVRLVPEDEEALERLKEVQKAYVYNLLNSNRYDEALIQADDFLARFTNPSDPDVITVEEFRTIAAELAQAGPGEAEQEQPEEEALLIEQLSDEQLLTEAIRAYRKKDYDVAEDLLLSAREANPYNIEVTRWLDRVRYQKYLHKRSYREAIRKDMLDQVQTAWIERPRAPRVEVGPVGPPEPAPVSRAREIILKKLETIIPKVDFEDAELKEVIRFLSREADVNIVIDPVVLQAGGVGGTPGPLESYPEEGGFGGEGTITIPGEEEPGLEGFAPQGSLGPAARVAAGSPGGQPTLYGQPPGGGRPSLRGDQPFGEEPTGMTPGRGVYAPPQQSTITLHLTDVPLKDVLKYVLRFKNLKYVVEDYAILIIPIDYVLPEEMVTEIFRLSTSGIGISATAQAGTMGEGEEGFGFDGGGYGEAGFGQEAGGGGGQPQTIKEWLKGATGVSWPEGSDLVYHQPTATLIVTNTPTNMVLIRELIRIWDRPPMQVEVEARFAYIKMDHGFENAFRLGMTDALRWTRNDERNLGVLPLASRERVEVLSDPGSLIGTMGLDSARYDSSDLTGTGTSGFDQLLSIRGILTRPEFSLVWYALDKTTTTELLSAPRVTTISGQQAQIQDVEEISYPTEYETEAIEEVREVAAGTTLFHVTPESFETRPVGIQLTVTPTVSSDGEVITLVLLPEVTELLGWDEFGSPVETSEGPVVPSIQPRFGRRFISTTVYINDGETLVLGGIIKGETETVEDRVPVLGNLPILGRLFRGSYEIDTKANLMIFVTADLISSRGTRMKREQQVTEQRALYLEQYQREREAAEAEGLSVTTGGQ